MKSTSKAAIFAAFFGLPMVATAFADGPTTTIRTEYLMTLTAPLTSLPIDQSLTIVSVAGGGSVTGKVSGSFVGAGGDWLRTMPSGILRPDIRAAIQTDDKQLIYVTFNGVISCDKPTMDRVMKGELVKSDECCYIGAPTFETQSEKYSWLNAIQTIAKMVEVKLGEGSHVTYDVYLVK